MAFCEGCPGISIKQANMSKSSMLSVWVLNLKLVLYPLFSMKFLP